MEVWGEGMDGGGRWEGDRLMLDGVELQNAWIYGLEFQGYIDELVFLFIA